MVYVMTLELMERPNGPLATLQTLAFDALLVEYHGQLGRLLASVERNGVAPEQILAWVEEAEALLHEGVAKRDRARLYEVRGRALRALARKAEATASFRRSLSEYDDPNNPSVAELERLSGPSGSN